MSDAKFAAAKELVREKHYDAARAVLRTINDPKATKWLSQLDQIAPEQLATTTEAETFFREENKKRKGQQKKAKRREVFRGIDLALYGIGTVGLAGILIVPVYMNGGTPDSGMMLLAGIGVLLTIAGIWQAIRRSRKPA